LAEINAPLEVQLIKDQNLPDEWYEYFVDVTASANTSVNNSAAVDLNTTHRTSDGKDHSDVVLNNTHRTSSGADHTFINQDVTTTASPTFVGLTVDTLTVDGKDMIKWAVLQGG